MALSYTPTMKMLQRIFLLQCPDPLQRSAAVLDERLRQHLRLGIRREEDALKHFSCRCRTANHSLCGLSLRKGHAEMVSATSQREEKHFSAIMRSRLWRCKLQTVNKRGKTGTKPERNRSWFPLYLEPTTGLEPVTCRLRIGCSTN
jgi:hypothetical protein